MTGMSAPVMNLAGRDERHHLVGGGLQLCRLRAALVQGFLAAHEREKRARQRLRVLPGVDGSVALRFLDAGDEFVAPCRVCALAPSFRRRRRWRRVRRRSWPSGSRACPCLRQALWPAPGLTGKPFVGARMSDRAGWRGHHRVTTRCSRRAPAGRGCACRRTRRRGCPCPARSRPSGRRPTSPHSRAPRTHRGRPRRPRCSSNVRGRATPIQYVRSGTNIPNHLTSTARV